MGFTKQEYGSVGRLQLNIAGVAVVYMLVLSLYTASVMFGTKCPKLIIYDIGPCDAFVCRDFTCRDSERLCDENRFQCTGSLCFQQSANDYARHDGISDEEQGDYVEQWTKWGEYEYFISGSQDSTWYEARATCERNRGTLAVITNQAESDFLGHITQPLQGSNATDYTEQRYWIGLRPLSDWTCTCEEGTSEAACLSCRASWYWYDDTLLQFEYWKDFEPRRYSCGSFTTNGWVANECHSNSKYICERCATEACVARYSVLNSEVAILSDGDEDSGEGSIDGNSTNCALSAMSDKPWWYAELEPSTILRHVIITGILPTSDVNSVSIAVKQLNTESDIVDQLRRPLRGSIEKEWCTLPDEALISGRQHSIADSKLRASSSLDHQHAAWRSRLDMPLEDTGVGGWCPTWSDVLDPWIQADLEREFYVNRVVTQGRADNDQWTKSFAVGYSVNGEMWRKVKNSRGRVIEFMANVDHNRKESVVLPLQLLARYIRVHPITWTWNGLCMRFEVYGCAKRVYSVLMPEYAASDVTTNLIIYEGNSRYTSQLQICYIETFTQRPPEFDECASRPCLHGGQCDDYDNSFMCTCAAGYEGRFCERDTDECLANECENRAACIDGINAYTCSCRNGYAGAVCQYVCDGSLGNSCFWVDTNERLNWFEAMDKCVSFGGRLADLENPDQASVATKILRVIFPVEDIVEDDAREVYSVWLGGRYWDLSSEWRWDENEQSFGYHNWEDTNDRTPTNPEADLCSAAGGAARKWFSAFCEHVVLYPLCEYEPEERLQPEDEEAQ